MAEAGGIMDSKTGIVVPNKILALIENVRSLAKKEGVEIVTKIDREGKEDVIIRLRNVLL